MTDIIKEIRYLDGAVSYVELENGVFVRLRGDGTGTDDETGEQWETVHRELENGDFEFLGWKTMY